MLDSKQKQRHITQSKLSTVSQAPHSEPVQQVLPSVGSNIVKNQLAEPGDLVKNQHKLLPTIQDVTKSDPLYLNKCASPMAMQFVFNPAALAGQVKLPSLS